MRFARRVTAALCGTLMVFLLIRTTQAESTLETVLKRGQFI